MARELKIKKSDGKLYEVELPENYQAGFNQNLDRSKKNGETIIRETREYELITPLFGGGAITKKADEVSIIRATEIRGHLRFWWRATRGGQFNGDLAEMKKHEDAIFGSTEENSALQIEVILEEDYKKRSEENKKLRQWAYKKIRKPNGKPQTLPSEVVKDFQYAAFPLQPEIKDDFGWESEINVGVKFKVTFSYPENFKIFKKNRKGEIIKDGNGKPILEIDFDSSPEIQAALWAWGIFGGIGARTRRGFGALKLTKKNGIPQTDEIFVSVENFQEKANEYIYGGKTPKGAPYLDKVLRFKVTSENKNSTEVWKKLIDTYKFFRQQRIGTGRSKWNEPEVIRNLTGQRLKTSNPTDSHPSKKPDFEKFPRAEFGLPIVFQFHFEDTWKNRKVKSDDKNVDPRKTILKVSDLPNQKRERFSSPLILRPIACQNGNFVGIALILENDTTLDELGLTLEAQEHPKIVVKSRLKSKLDETTKEHEQIKAVDGTNLLSSADVLQAFLDYLEK